MLTSFMPVLPGETLGNKYKIVRLLGKGGMGVVVAAHHLDLDAMVAIKFLSIANAGASIDRFLREARSAAKVKSEHVCHVFDVGRLETGEPYIVMEHLEGIDLAEKLQKEGPQPLSEVAGWIVQACDAIAEAHEHGIVHRDLKPANIFLATRSDGTICAKVLDFGISKVAVGQATTNAHALMGSPLYMPPEQIESASGVDRRADVWSLGVVLYELLTGEPPFEGESIIELAFKIRERPCRPPSELKRELPNAVDAIIARCLEKDPAKRYPSVADLSADLAPYAPDDVRGIATRLARRRLSSPDLDVDAKTERAPEPSGPRKESGYDLTEPARDISSDRIAAVEKISGSETAVSEPHLPSTPSAKSLTLNPVSQSPQTTARRRRYSPRRAAAIVVGGLAVLALATFSVREITRPKPAAPAALVAPATSEPTVAAPAPTTSITTAPSASVTTTAVIATTHPPTSKVASAPPPPSPKTGEAAPPIASPPPASTPVVPPPEPAASRKKHEIDRSDPFAKD